MFADACAKAVLYTRPIVAEYYCVDGECRPAVASFVVVNEAGWIVTDGHVDKMIRDLASATLATKAHQAKIAAVHADKKLSKGNRKVALRNLGEPRFDAPLSYFVWWSWDGVQLKDVAVLPEADLMVGRLDPFDPTWIAEYPIFKDPNSPIRQGTSLCRFGFPFPNVKATYDMAKNHFTITQLGLPPFPIDGLLTRTIENGDNPAGYKNRFIETSSPGLKGQSGGPILDTTGAVWGIQSQTQHLSLGFDPEVLDDHGRGTKKKEHQFLNVGWASHPESVVGFLKERGVSHRLAP